MTNSRRTSARLLAGLAPFLLAGLALPLLAPSCGDFQPGVKTFAKGSLIIPMDVCYQCTRQSADGLDGATANCTLGSYTSPGGVACPQALQQGDVIKAYGLVYQLIRNDVAVYWAIDPAKAAVDGEDFQIQFNGGFPVQRYDWAAGGAGAPATSQKTIHYRGGPFVVDGSDAVKAQTILRAFQATYSAVNVHVSNVAFQAPVAKTMAGGWSAGGAVPPKLALLNIGSGNLSNHGNQATCTGSGDTKNHCDSSYCIGSAKNAEPVIEGYLSKAGIGSGTAGGSTAANAHGEIYDRLLASDFIPSDFVESGPGATLGDWKKTTFYLNNYQILWVPHWVAPGSCSAAADGSGNINACACLASRLTANKVKAILQTIGHFSQSHVTVTGETLPGDIFAECAGLGSFEGAFASGSNTSYTVDYSQGDPSTRFQTLTGVRYNEIPNNPFPSPNLAPGGANNFPSPLMQLGDFPFNPYTGAIEDYRPADASGGGYQPLVSRLISGSSAGGNDYSAWNYFTFRPPDPSKTHGNIVYLAGHSYSGVQGNFQVGGTRLVLNTLFNLGAGCTESGVACDTGKPGACGRGVLKCGSNGQTVCTQTVFPTAEVCNGLDDDCNGLVDDKLIDPASGQPVDAGCYDGPPGTLGVGLCRAGVKTCQQAPDGTWGLTACQNQVLPTSEVCNGLDDNCNGQVDENLRQDCYDGPSSTVDPASGVPYGACKTGTQSCSNGSWTACAGEILPVPNPCSGPEAGTGGGLDLDCDGRSDACDGCTNGASQACYTGPSGTQGVGPCHGGTQTCAANLWGPCVGQVVPQPEICQDGIDQGCHGDLTNEVNGPGTGVAGSGHDGPPFCNACKYSPVQGSNSSLVCWTGPATGVVFSNTNPASVCKKGQQFCQINGEFATTCVGETLPGQELCNGKDDDCNGLVDDGASCGTGFACKNGVCVFDSCAPELPCREGYDCVVSTPGQPGHCEVNRCGTGPVCPAGQVCNQGTCDDPCAAITCGPGSTCAGGFCTGGSCYSAGCPSGQVCQAGACVADACAGAVCPTGTFCRQGDCVQSCAFAQCGAGQACDVDGFCVADPCSGKSCGPTQTCVNGACVTDPCAGLACGQGQVCSGGVCADDPCNGVACPVGLCRDGQCFSVTRTSSSGPAGEKSSSGCGCGGGAGSPLALLGLLLALPLSRRRRRGQGATLIALVAAGGLLASGCTKKTTTPFDPASCAAATPPLATCEGETRCIDFNGDPSHCGVCGAACNEGEWCVDGHCGPASAVAPHIASVAPTTASRGGLSPVTVTLTGERFKAGATLRASSLSGTVTVPATVSGGTLTAQLDLSTAAAGAWTLRVVNPDLVISNGRGWSVVVPTPTVTAVIPDPNPSPGASPPQVTAGLASTLTLQGSGFMVDSDCHVGDGSLTEQVIPSTLTAAGLVCELDASSIPPGTYGVWVSNNEAHVSTHQPFRVTSAVPAITSISPSASPVGIIPLDVFGSGFDQSSLVYFGLVSDTQYQQTTTFVDGGRLFLAQLDLSHCPGSGVACSGTYQITVKNGGVASNAVPFFVGATVPTASGLSPGSAYQGDHPLLTVVGASLPGSTVMEYRPPGGTFTALTTATSGGGTASTATLNLAGKPAGQYDVRLNFGAFTSATFVFRVLSNTAVISGAAQPGLGAQGATVPVVLTVANLHPTTPPGGLTGITVVFSGTPGAPLTPTQPQAGQLAVALPLANVAAGVYTLTVVNPNAQPSNPVNFTVSPGPPTVTGVACVGAPSGQCPTASSAPQQVAAVPIRITGTNFARPDVAGNNGSVIHVFSGCTPVVDGSNVATCTCPPGTIPCVPDFVIPTASVTVTSATQLDVALDTTLAVPATYSFWVWNPGGSNGQQRSPSPYKTFQITP